MAVTNSRLEEMKMELDLERPVYEKCLARMTGEDKDWVKRKAALEEKVCRAILSFNSEDSPTKAVFILGGLQDIVREMLAPFDRISAYEAKASAAKRYENELKVKETTGTSRAQARAAGMVGGGVRL